MKTIGAVLLLSLCASAQQFTTLYQFHSYKGHPDGYGPYGTLLQNGNMLYGTTPGGGSGPGTIFSFDLNSGTEKLLHQFSWSETAHIPVGGLVADQLGNLYGTTKGSVGAGGAGAIYKIPASGGALSVLWVFKGQAGGPLAGLTRVGTNFYGTTSVSGDNHPYGDVFRLNSKDVVATQWSFKNTPDGANPGYGSLIFDSLQQNAYGTTLNGGAAGMGTVFELNIKTKVETILHSFAGGLSDGSYPYGGLVMDAAGNLYGTTSLGGTFDCGTIFEISNGVFTVLYSFSGMPDGRVPYAGLTMDAAGNLYGTTISGGDFDQGTIFEWSDGIETVLHSFDGGKDGVMDPIAMMTLDANGMALYGTTEVGGHWNGGTIFKITLP